MAAGPSCDMPLILPDSIRPPRTAYGESLMHGAWYKFRFRGKYGV